MGANTLFIITNTIKLRSEPLHNLWLLPWTLSTAQSTWCLSNPVYNSGASPTVVDEDVQFDLEYGEGSAQGEYLEDIVWVGGVQVPNSIFSDASTSCNNLALIG